MNALIFGAVCGIVLAALGVNIKDRPVAYCLATIVLISSYALTK